MNTLFSHPERQNNFQRVIPNFFLNCSHYCNLGGNSLKGSFVNMQESNPSYKATVYKLK